MSGERNWSELAFDAWGSVFVLAVAAACGFAQLLPEISGGITAPVGFRWVTHANTSLAGAAAVYIAYYWLGVERVGQAASLLAALGAFGVPLGLLADAAQAAPLRDAGSQIGLYEGTALFSAAAVFVYLVMERIYQDRAAALLIMPAVLLAILCEMWLVAEGGVAPDRIAPSLSGYWAMGQRFSACVGYSALAMGAGCGAWMLTREAGSELTLRPKRDTIVGAAAISAPMLLIGTGMGVAWFFTDDGGVAFSGTVGATLPAFLAAAALLAWVRRPGLNTRHLAWYAVITFAVSVSWLAIGFWPGEAPG